jgi:hypothetical protein
MESKKYTPPPKPAKPADYEQFIASLSETDRVLHQLGEEKLGSSYFVQWTHQYREWAATKATANAVAKK